MKIVNVVLSEEAKKNYLMLKKKDKIIINSIKKKVKMIKNDFHYGQPINKNKIPKNWKIKYGIKNLFRVELAGFWRLLYTLSSGSDKFEVNSFVVGIVDHKEYNKLFNYN